ncbi:MAG: Phosphoglycolate phosphatase [Syntrophus sp. SKADARSKE-3]|nr:Phosphoglycolate phosphatase [Syntrophus sp. SKADARSKE-3]
MKRIDLMIFDLDGTLAATGKDLVISVNYTLASLGLETVNDDKIISYVGNGIRNLLIRSLGPDHRNKIEEALRIFSSYYGDHIMDHTTLYPGVVDCLEHFREKKKVVLSNKRKRYVDIILEALGIMHYFDQTMGGDSRDYMKPDPRLIEILVDQYVSEREKTVIIGDGINDILLARNAHILSCAFLGGLTDREVLLGLKPDDTCETLADMKSLYI